MDMPDNSNPKMKHALFFHRKKNQAPTSTSKSRQTEPVRGQTYNLLTGKKQRNSSFLNNFWREKKEATTTECDWSEGEKERTPSFARNADASSYWGSRCTIGYRNTLSGREPAYHADVCFGQSICHGQGRKQNYGQLMCPGQGRKQNMWSVDLPWARKETKYVVS
jgi:hypothetical protein